MAEGATFKVNEPNTNVLSKLRIHVNPPGGVLPYISYNRYVPPHRIGFCAVLVSKRVWFSRELRECKKKEREIYEFEMDLKNFFVCALI